jgi:hypothetical protein
VGCAGGLAVLVLAGADNVAVAIGVRLAALALLALLAAVVLGWSALVPVSLLLLGAAYATRLYADDAALDAKAPLLAAGLLLTAELGYWSLEERQDVRSEAGDGLRHLGLVALLALGGLASGAVLLAAADLGRTEGLAVDLLGALAAASALLVLVLYARRPG